MEDARELVELYEQRNGPLSPPRPEDSFVHTEEELEQGRTQIHAAAGNLPPLKIPAQESATSASQRYPEMGGVLTLFRMGIEDNPGLIPGAVGNPALWRRVSELDRSSGRLIYAGQLLQNGGETGELTVAAAVHGLCEGTSKQAAALIAAPATPEPHKSALRAAFCEPFRLLTEYKTREAQQQKVNQESKKPLQEQVSEAEESAAMSRAIEGFLGAQGAPT